MAEKKLDVSVISPEKILYHGEADSLVLPGVEGLFGVFPDHATLVSMLDYGILEIRNGNSMEVVVIDSGFAEIKANKVSVLADGGEVKEDIDVQFWQEALQEAESMLDATDRSIRIQKAKIRLLAHSK